MFVYKKKSSKLINFIDSSQPLLISWYLSYLNKWSPLLYVSNQIYANHKMVLVFDKFCIGHNIDYAWMDEDERSCNLVSVVSLIQWRKKIHLKDFLFYNLCNQPFKFVSGGHGDAVDVNVCNFLQIPFSPFLFANTRT